MGRRYLPAGESALVVEFGETADPVFNARVLALDAALRDAAIEGVREMVPTYRSLMVHFDPRLMGTAELITVLDGLSDAAVSGAPAGKHWRIPACYEAPHGEDLDEIAGLLGLAPERVADLHASARYNVVMYGFAPGFVFLSGLPDELSISRRQTPRPPARPGALTIANGQALIASIAMPTGWYVIGRTTARTFDPGGEPAFPLGVGDSLDFERIDAATFDALAKENRPLTPAV